MSGVRYRRRGTAIVETDRGILLTAGRPGKPFILPWGRMDLMDTKVRQNRKTEVSD
jgi:hypothetical protein